MCKSPAVTRCREHTTTDKLQTRLHLVSPFRSIRSINPEKAPCRLSIFVTSSCTAWFGPATTRTKTTRRPGPCLTDGPLRRSSTGSQAPATPPIFRDRLLRLRSDLQRARHRAAVLTVQADRCDLRSYRETHSINLRFSTLICGFHEDSRLAKKPRSKCSAKSLTSLTEHKSPV